MNELIQLRENYKKMTEEKEKDKKKRISMRKTINELKHDNKNKNEQIKILNTRIQYLESQLIIEDEKYKEIINYS